jgi:hypothetical protein
MLEDLGMTDKYPHLTYDNLSNDGNSNINLYPSCISGNRVHIEQNQKIKFIMLFTVLDSYIDATHPDLESLSFSKKYKALPNRNDSEVILRELFRFSKVIRNALVHNPSSFNMIKGYLNVNYEFKDTSFRAEISCDSLNYFYTALIMFTKGDLGRGNYFIGMVRFAYNSFLTGIRYFSDEFEDKLAFTSDNLRIRLDNRTIVKNASYHFEDENLIINYNLPEKSSGNSNVDFVIELDSCIFLVPIESLGKGLKINKLDLLNNWKYEGPFPPLK